jgi:fructose/tagatose bisphosphate aldolase
MTVILQPFTQLGKILQIGQLKPVDIGMEPFGKQSTSLEQLDLILKYAQLTLIGASVLSEEALKSAANLAIHSMNLITLTKIEFTT